MSRRGGARKAKMTHSVKKLIRRFGTASTVKGQKSKKKAPTHPGHRPINNHQAKRIELEATEVENTATAARAEKRRELGKAARLDQLAKRRGLAINPDAQSASAIASERQKLEEEAAVDPDAEAAAMNAAKRALAGAPSSQRAYHKELSVVLKSADILLEVIDARDPMGCRCLPLEDAVMAKCRGKRIVLILNKVDLVPAEITQKWLSYLRQYFPTLPFKAATQTSGLGKSGGSGAVGKQKGYGSEAYGGEQLLQLLKNYSRSRQLKTAITVGIVGYPNVGKSSVINSLKRARAVNVGATPGVTTKAQVVSLDKKVKLMDCPGIVFARASTAQEMADVQLRNCVRVEKIDDPQAPVEAILRRVPQKQLTDLYGLPRFGGVVEFLTLLAGKRGHLRKGGAPDHEQAARAVLNDWNEGKIKYHTEPPQPTGGVELVPRLAEGFDWEAMPHTEEREESAAAAAEVTAEQAALKVHAAAAKAAAAAAKAARANGGVAPAVQMDEEAPVDGSLLTGWKQAHDRAADAKPKPRRAPTKRAAAVTIEDDDRFNFQHNRGVRKAAQSKKKKAAKRASAGMLLG